MGYTYKDSPICCPDEESAPSLPALDAPPATPPGAVLRGTLEDGTPVTPSLLREWQRLALHVADGFPVETEWDELPPEDVMIYRQTAAPGARAPHVWLDDGRSTLDLFGHGFTLLRIGTDAPDAKELVAAARTSQTPLQVHHLTADAVQRAYRRRLVLVRPDGHVAWRGDQWPEQGPAALLDHVRGARAMSFD